MADQVLQYKFLDIDGVSVLKQKLDDVINNSEQNAKDYADSLADNYDASGSAATAEQNSRDYTNQQIDTAFKWGEF